MTVGEYLVRGFTVPQLEHQLPTGAHFRLSFNGDMVVAHPEMVPYFVRPDGTFSNVTFDGPPDWAKEG